MILTGGADIPLSFYAEVLGQSHERVRSAYLEAGGIDVDAETYTQTYRQIYQRLLRTDLELAPGSLELLRQLSQKGYALAVVSSSHSRAVNQILGQTGLGEFFDVQVSGDDVDRKKPAPDAYLRALDMLAVPSTSAIVIEDSESGVQAAINAGMRVFAVRHSMNVRHDLVAAYAVLDSLCDTTRIVNLIALLLGVESE
jgi:HAD superfamily hydrolase (TIGR01509 family)